MFDGHGLLRCWRGVEDETLLLQRAGCRRASERAICDFLCDRAVIAECF